VVVGAQNAVDYSVPVNGVTGAEEVCPQRPLEDWTGADSLMAPCVCLITLLIVQMLPINPTGVAFTPVPADEPGEKKEIPSSTQESAQA